MGTRRAGAGDSARDVARPRESQKTKWTKKETLRKGCKDRCGCDRKGGGREDGGIKNVLMSTNCVDGKRGGDWDA